MNEWQLSGKADHPSNVRDVGACGQWQPTIALAHMANKERNSVTLTISDTTRKRMFMLEFGSIALRHLR
jgi:hypothetical protein